MTHTTIWKGKLAVGGREAEEFDAAIARRGDGTLAILRGDTDGGLRVVAPPEIRGESWLRALATIADRVVDTPLAHRLAGEVLAEVADALGHRGGSDVVEHAESMRRMLGLALDFWLAWYGDSHRDEACHGGALGEALEAAGFLRDAKPTPAGEALREAARRP